MNARIRLAIALLFGASLAASAQTRPATPQAAPTKPAPAAGAAPSVDPNAIVQAALTVAQLIDRGQVAQVWQGASPVARAAATEQQFVDGITAKRNALGTPVAREWTSVSRNLVPAGGNVPAGAYVSARFQTRFPGNRVAEELVSLHFDNDNTWRLAGYTIN